jgi:Tol biopolymer transport system component
MVLRWDFRTVLSRRTKAIACLSLVCIAGGVGACAADAQEASKIAFVSDRDGNQEIYVINPDGSGLTNLTQHPEKDFAPSWSPDGSRIAFRSHRGDGYYNLYLMDADGSNPTRLVTNAGDDGSGDYTPHWSPDGTKILFESRRNDAYAAYGSSYVVNVDGLSLTSLRIISM